MTLLGRYATERFISSGTVAGMLWGLFVGAVAFTLAVLMFEGVLDGIDREPVKAAWLGAFGVILVAAGVNCVASGLLSYRHRRAPRAAGDDGEMAGEESVMAALKAGRVWALVVCLLYGGALVVSGVAAPLSARDVGVTEAAGSLVIAGFGALFIWSVLKIRKNPRWLDED